MSKPHGFALHQQGRARAGRAQDARRPARDGAQEPAQPSPFESQTIVGRTPVLAQTLAPELQLKLSATACSPNGHQMAMQAIH